MEISNNPVEKLTYEQAFAELESIVEALEANQITLENALALFERGQALTLYCTGLLDKAELRVRVLTDPQSGEPEE